jgi:CysZ protein
MVRGAGFAVRGCVYLATNVRLWRYAILPAAVYLLALLLMGALAWFLADDAYRLLRPESLAQPLAEAPWWRDGLRWLLKALLAVAAILMVTGGALLGTLLVAALLAGPFNEKLSEVVELLESGSLPADQPFRLAALTQDVVRAVWGAVQRLGLFLAVFVPLFMLSLLPLAGLLGAAGIFLYSCYFLGLNFLDPVLDRRRLSLRQKLGWTRSVLAVHMGFGLALFGMMLIPVLNLFLAPCFVVGGTLLWLELEGDG